MTTPWLPCNTSRLLFSLSGALALGALSGCATVANSNYAKPMDFHGNLAKDPKTTAGLVISGEEDSELASPYVGVVLVTFENPTNRWVHVKGMALGFGNPANEADVSVPMGEELESWARSANQLELIHRTNRTVALSVLALAGGVTAVASGHKSAVGLAGATVASGSLAALAASSMGDAVSAAEAPYFEDHLLAVPFSIPPGMFTKRWVALNTKGGQAAPCIESMLLDYELDTGHREKVWLTYRDRRSRSPWQEASCKNYGNAATPALARSRMNY